jgi:TetR/AcrR family transcriptional regulator, regulator of cefoperazone and chloramphenicol sensitivity
MRKTNSSTVDTRELILNAAGRIFAKNGFHATTVRQITQEAGVNLAAVNYHFHDKQELYVSVLKRAHQAAANTAEADYADTPRQQLRTFIRTFLAYLLDPKRPEWQGSLIAREMAQPTQALDRLVAESIAPVKRRIVGIVRELLGPDVPETRVNLSCASIIGQCLHYVHCREMITRLFPKGSSLPRDIETLSDHVFEFSLGGLTAMKDRKKAGPSRRRKSRPTVSL